MVSMIWVLTIHLSKKSSYTPEYFEKNSTIFFALSFAWPITIPITFLLAIFYRFEARKFHPLTTFIKWLARKFKKEE